MSNARKLVIGNWKLNPATLKEAKKIFTDSTKGIPRGVEVVICPPSLYLSELERLSRSRTVSFGVQNLFWETVGPFTGELSGSMAESVGATFAIVGHSERRALGETNEIVSSKVSAALKTGLKAVLCVGEREHDSYGNYLPELQSQIEKSLTGVAPSLLSSLIVAYEPLWAIGKSTIGGAMTPRELHETVIFIRKVLHDRFGKKALSIPILYGGAVAPENSGVLISEGKVRGLLVGGQSLKPKAFREILQAVAKA